MAARVVFQLSAKSYVGHLKKRLLLIEISNLQDMFIITKKLDSEYFYPHFEKQNVTSVCLSVMNSLYLPYYCF